MPPCRSSATPTRLRGLVPLGNPWCRRLVAEPCTRCSPGLPRPGALTRCPRSAYPKVRARRRPPPKRRTAEAVSIVSKSAVHRDPKTACGPRAAPAAQRCREDERGRFVRPRAHMGRDVTVACQLGLRASASDPKTRPRRPSVVARSARRPPAQRPVQERSVTPPKWCPTGYPESPRSPVVAPKGETALLLSVPEGRLGRRPSHVPRANRVRGASPGVGRSRRGPRASAGGG
jgi:hypothetical protein